MQGKVIIVSAPSGAGKTSIVRHLLQAVPELQFSISATTRAKRDYETDGKDYYFITPDEFRNRLDAVIPFARLDSEIMGRVADKFLNELKKNLADKKILLEVNYSAKDWLIKKGFDPQNGARPLARVIQEQIKKPLAEEILFGNLIRGGT